MLFGFVAIALIIFIIISVLLSLSYFLDEHDERPNVATMVLILSITIGLIVWISLFSSCDLKEKNIKMLKINFIYSENGDEIAVINYLKYNNLKSINLNEKFKKQISKDDMVKVTEYEYGPYYGLYYATLEDKIEIIKK